MELGNFLGKLKGINKEEPKNFLALILTDEVVQAAVWNVTNEVTEILSLGTPVEWDGDTGTTSELITAVDATISSATEGLGDEPNNIILGIPHSWTDKNGILGVKKEFISKIRKELELEAIGYVVITDSILSYLKMQEGTPTTSILIQVSRDELILVLVRLGRIEAIESIGRSDDIVDDVTEGIARFKATDNLPSRIILFNSMHNLDEQVQSLLSVDWQSQFNFLHIPKIETLAKDITIRALVVAGGSEVAKSLGLSISDPIPASSESDLAGGDSRAGDLAEGQVGTPKMGGVSSSEKPESELLTAQEIGFTSPKIDFIDPDDEPETDPVPTVQNLASASLPAQVGIRNFAIQLPKLKLPKLHFPKFKFSLKSTKPILWYLGGGALILTALSFYLIWLLPSAILTVQVTPKILEENVEITLSTTDSSIDFSSRIVPASIESVTATGEKILETTGEKTIGEPSVGEVTIYNRTTANKTFVKGATISLGSLKFSLDSDVQVASKSAGSDYIDVPGKANVKITAISIGADSNLAAGSEFSVASFGKDSYVAKNEVSLSGGSSEQVQAVSKDDQNNLVKALTEELLHTLTTKAQASSVPGTGVYLIPDSSAIESVTYSAKIGETASSLTANLTLKASLLKYQTEDVTTLVNSSIDTAIPSGYIRANLPSTVDLSASSVSENNDSVKGTAKVKVSLLPVVDESSLRISLKGQSSGAIASLLSSSIPGYQSAELKVLPFWMPTRLKKVPLNPSQININILPAL